MRKGGVVRTSHHLELRGGMCYVQVGVPHVGTGNVSLAGLEEG